jgi:hypothetical protein
MINFFIVGAQRCATTYLYTLLEEHPQIATVRPFRPEPKYFLGQSWNGNKEDYINKYFSHTKPVNIAYGEKSTSYYESEDAAKRIKYLFPEAKIVFSLRNPVYRALSNYYFSLENKLETRTFEEVFILNKPTPSYPPSISTNPFDYLGRGLYYKYITLYLKYFNKEKLDIIFSEEFLCNLAEVQKLYSFIGVAANFVPPSLHKKVNESKAIKSVPNTVITYLNGYYEESINLLGKLLGVEITWW